MESDLPIIGRLQVRMGFESVEEITSIIPESYAGMVRINSDGKAFWYSFHNDHTQTYVAMDMPGSCRIAFRKNLSDGNNVSACNSAHKH